MNVSNLYRKIKQVLEDSNVALVNKGLNNVNNLYEIPNEIVNLGEINRLPYLLRNEITKMFADDFDGISKINHNAFYGCTSLQSVTIGDSVTSIGDSAFYGCDGLTSVTIGNGVTNISNNVFGFCSNLKTLTIGNRVTTIGGSVFNACNKLTDIYLNPITPPSLGNTIGIPDTIVIHVPIGSGDAYKSATNWSYFSDTIVEDIEV